MKVHLKHGKVTQNMNGASINYGYIWPVSAPHVRCFPRVFYSWPCLLRQVGTALISPYDCIVTVITYANPGSRQNAIENHPVRSRSYEDVDPRKPLGPNAFYPEKFKEE